jgi:hypothetical protein
MHNNPVTMVTTCGQGHHALGLYGVCVGSMWGCRRTKRVKAPGGMSASSPGSGWANARELELVEQGIKVVAGDAACTVQGRRRLASCGRRRRERRSTGRGRRGRRSSGRSLTCTWSRTARRTRHDTTRPTTG